MIRRDLPGGGYLNATKSALEALAAGEERQRQLAGPGIKHASEIAAEQRQREDAIEAARRAGPDPRAVLAAAIAMQAETQAEIDRLAVPLTRARALVADLERRQQDHAAAVDAGDEAAAAGLIEALAAGTASPNFVPADALPATFEAELRSAKLALGRLMSEDRTARDLLTRRTHGTARCAHAVLVDEAVELADQIIDQAQQLAEARADLAQLERLLTGENRRLNASPAPLPAPISRALFGTATPAEASTDWRARYSRLQREGADPVEASP